MSLARRNEVTSRHGKDSDATRKCHEFKPTNLIPERPLNRDTTIVSIVVTTAGQVQDGRCGTGGRVRMDTTNPMMGVQRPRCGKKPVETEHLSPRHILVFTPRSRTFSQTHPVPSASNHIIYTGNLQSSSRPSCMALFSCYQITAVDFSLSSAPAVASARGCRNEEDYSAAAPGMN